MSLLYKLLGVVLLIASLVIGWFWQSYTQYQITAVGFSGEDKTFVIKPGSAISTVVNKLISDGIVTDRSRFMWMVKHNDKARNIQAGEYIISADMTPKKILETFITGKVKQHSFTIVEGWNFKQLLVAIRGSDKITHTLTDKTPDEIMKILGHENEHPEGRFLPDTYKFPAGMTDKAFLKRAYDAMEAVLKENWPERNKDLPFKTAYEALILASIVEKETGVAREREQIAGVFVRRLKKRMRLQTDPTVIYGMGDAYNGNVRKKDLIKDTPYNTYRRKGLPPTPIAMPGAAAIKAALHPAEGDELYFVAKGDGSHYFSATVKEHNKAVRQYQIRSRKKDYRSAPDMDSQ
ncbi:MAG: endolytic transglycosylase MltG [Gammaproteobacteria bacterium]|nr:endolytic transglycosylase MltG [Gammaproteobacteria bacterium]